MKKEPRSIKTVSFARNDYEQGLLEFATDPAHGTFSQYVKRLIERDRDGLSTIAAPIKAPAKASDTSKKDREEANRLLFGD